MEIDNLVDSNIMQIIPRDFAVDIVETMMSDLTSTSAPATAPIAAAPPPQAAAPPIAAAQPQAPPQAVAPPPQAPAAAPAPPVQEYAQPIAAAQPQAPQAQPMAYPYPPAGYYPPEYAQPVTPQNVTPVQFQPFDTASLIQQKENIGLIMDVPLEVTVELGRTSKKIKDILEFVPGTIIELDKLAGDPIDILVNGKFVARGEVVVIDENFGVKITDIINVEDRI